ncbi:transmembrane and coiled-coil domains-containing protein 7 [Irineochytrium annulatum]|nr:transmembrane and coiled-coil domains-containing protein 7 [Irineochytrium annulatum]
MALADSPVSVRDCGAQLSTILVSDGGVSAVVETLAGPHMPASFVESIAQIFVAKPRILASPEEYYFRICPQLNALLRSPTTPKPNARMASLLVVRLIKARPKLGRLHLVEPLLSPLLRYDRPVPPTNTAPARDLDGNCVLTSAADLTAAMESLRRLLLVGELPDHLAATVVGAAPALYAVHEWGVGAGHRVVANDAMGLLRSCLKMSGGIGGGGVDDTALAALGRIVEIGFVDVRWGVKVVASEEGGPMFVVVEGGSGASRMLTYAEHAQAFASFLDLLQEPEWTSTLFIRCLESATSSGEFQLGLTQLLVCLMDRFQEKLVADARRVVAFVGGLLSAANVDVEMMGVGIAVLGLVAGGDEEALAGLRDTDLDEILIILQALKSHVDENVRVQATQCHDALASLREGLGRKGTGPAESEKMYRGAIKELSDALLPVRAHGMGTLRRMIARMDEVAEANLATVLELFLEALKDNDSFVYLHAVNCLSTVTDVYPERTLKHIMRRYVSADVAVITRERLGEVVLRTIQRMGTAFPKYVLIASHVLLPLLIVMEEQSKPMRSSAISLLATIAEQSSPSLHSEIFWLLNYMTDLFSLEENLTNRRACAFMLMSLAKDVNSGSIPQGAVRELTKLLKRIEAADPDRLTRSYATVGLENMKAGFGM